MLPFGEQRSHVVGADCPLKDDRIRTEGVTTTAVIARARADTNAGLGTVDYVGRANRQARDASRHRRSGRGGHSGRSCTSAGTRVGRRRRLRGRERACRSRDPSGQQAPRRSRSDRPSRRQVQPTDLFPVGRKRGASRPPMCTPPRLLRSVRRGRDFRRRRRSCYPRRGDCAAARGSRRPRRRGARSVGSQSSQDCFPSLPQGRNLAWRLAP